MEKAKMIRMQFSANDAIATSGESSGLTGMPCTYSGPYGHLYVTGLSADGRFAEGSWGGRNENGEWGHGTPGDHAYQLSSFVGGGTVAAGQWYIVEEFHDLGYCAPTNAAGERNEGFGKFVFCGNDHFAVQ